MRVVTLVVLALVAGIFIGASRHADTSKAGAQAAPKVKNLLTSELAKELAPGRDVIVDLVEIPPNTSFERHWHPGEDFQYYLEGDPTLEIEGQPAVAAKLGTVGHVPYKTWHRATAGPKGAKVIVFRVHTRGEPVRSTEAQGRIR